ncbi:transglycosylase SLT domain-containing protein [Pseudomaricurvus alcaniphilus]|uniref:SPOR domain-containing protein n=1 Tax=Pseudomaricurvus alcaniphilus TaxID=1166482 RepID=UPI001408E9CE|nr:SPOR domain-containing protein [Pseudomaricurvus alcaniphilus]NHN36781.1 transglycosylase SLT domain-containing protein [Pseudomaricurvus alcaniphilus]
MSRFFLPIKRRKLLLLMALAALSLLLTLLNPAARAEVVSVKVPLYFDFPLLQHLLVKQLFNGADSSREILDDPHDCSRILLSNPFVSPQGENLEIVAAANARIGVALLGNCREIIRWQGRVRLQGAPVVEPGGRAVRLHPQQTWLIDHNGEKLFSGPLWDLANRGLRILFKGFVLDLSRSIEALGAFLPEVLPRHTAQQLQTTIDSLSLSGIQVTPESLNVTLEFAVEVPEQRATELSPEQQMELAAELAPSPAAEARELAPELQAEMASELGIELAAEPAPGAAAAIPPPPVAGDEAAVAALSAEELEQFENRWQMMDALLVSAVKHYASATHLLPLRAALLEVLLDSRYRLREALAEGDGHAEDAVRYWFIDSWQLLSPVIRRISMENPDEGDWLWLSVLTATDALRAIDHLGPAVGLDISTAGLRRLARMINAESGEELLRYGEGVDPQLQQLWQEQLQLTEPVPLSWRFNFSLFPMAEAAESAVSLNQWVPTVRELDAYLPLVASLLQETSKRVVAKHPLAQNQRALFTHLVQATAWQESCWRQYVVVNQRIEPLRSSANAIGLMQVSEHVWRGIYDLQKLRWDIEYNANAGTEILLNYMVNHALRRDEHNQPGGLPNLARATYSAYNGGPSQVARYRRNNVSTLARRIDRDFWDKYQQVEAGNALNVGVCLGQSKVAPGPGDSDVAWVREQPGNHLTLQLAAFGSRAAADEFIRKHDAGAKAHVYPRRLEGQIRYVVLYGSYANSREAIAELRKFEKLQPWMRQFQEIR